MTIAVRYHSRGGSTRKVAQAVAEALGVEALTVNNPLSEKTDAVFLGTALYANGVDEAVKTFLEENAGKIGTLYSFSTAAIAPSTYHQVKKLAEQYGITLSEREFHCRGKFLFMHASHPDEGDLVRARSFAKQALAKAEDA